MATITLGLARMGDAPRIAEMSRTLIEAGLPRAWTTARVAGLIRNRESLVVTARRGGDLVGFAMTQFGERSAHLALLAVTPGHRRAGLGRRLIEWTEESAVVAGVFRIDLEVRSSNLVAQRFYATLGYRVVGQFEGYYSGIEDAVRLSHDLTVVDSAAR
jgi:[ribosomal protein S18]-alanine N-acetyltransferase